MALALAAYGALARTASPSRHPQVVHPVPTRAPPTQEYLSSLTEQAGLLAACLADMQGGLAGLQGRLLDVSADTLEGVAAPRTVPFEDAMKVGGGGWRRWGGGGRNAGADSRRAPPCHVPSA